MGLEKKNMADTQYLRGIIVIGRKQRICVREIKIEEAYPEMDIGSSEILC